MADLSCRDMHKQLMNKYLFNGFGKVDHIHAISSVYSGIETPVDLYNALLHCWCRETCAPRMRKDWSLENQTLGQCSVTAFLAQDIFGGEVYGILTENGNMHCFNMVNGIVFDLTSAQFQDRASSLIYSLDNPQNRSMANHFQKAEKKDRYLLLQKKLMEYINC